jgi:amino acid transporter
MTSTTDTEQPVEHADLARFGYTQELHRRVGSFASFAAGFSYVSILTTVFQLFFLGFGFGGAAFFWTWPVVFFGQLLVALNFSTLAARFPISGAIFQWSSRLAGHHRAGPHRGGGGHRAAGRAAVHLVRLPAPRR